MMLSTIRPVLHVVIAFFLIALMGGSVYGWPSMRQILKRDGTLLSADCDRGHAHQTCKEQELAFGVVFTVGAWSNQGGRLFVGILLDRLGPRRTSSLCALLCAVGAVLFATMFSTLGLSLGYFCIGVGGAGMQLSLQSVSALFPNHRGMVMAMLSGAFQAASCVFLMFEAIHRLSDVRLSTLMLGYAGALVAAAVVCFMIWPRRPFGMQRKSESKEIQTASEPTDSGKQHSNDTPTSQVTLARAQAPVSAVDLPLQERSFRAQALTPEYLLATTFFAITVLQAQFTIGSIGTQFELKGDSGALTRSFNLIFSLSWLITPFVGHMVDRFGYPTMLFTMNTTMLCSCACLITPWQELQYVTAVLYTVGRVSIWATYFALNANVFGFANYGKLVGGGLFVASCFSLLQYPLLNLTFGIFDGDFTFANSIWIALSVLMYPVIAKLTCSLRLRQRIQSECTRTEVPGKESQGDRPGLPAAENEPPPFYSVERV